MAVFLVIVILFVTTFCMGVVRGSSMEPTYQDGQVVLVRRRTPFNSELHRNDVVLLQRDRGEVIIKRIFRLPGEEVPSGFPYLLEGAQGVYLRDYYEHDWPKASGPDNAPYTVPAGYIVVLGDNLPVSLDSRFFGPVPVRDIIGTVVNAPEPPPLTPDRNSGR